MAEIGSRNNMRESLSGLRARTNGQALGQGLLMWLRPPAGSAIELPREPPDAGTAADAEVQVSDEEQKFTIFLGVIDKNRRTIHGALPFWAVGPLVI